MDAVQKATEVFDIVIGELKTLKAHADLEPAERARMVAQLSRVAIQALALCHADYKHANDWHMRQMLKQMLGR